MKQGKGEKQILAGKRVLESGKWQHYLVSSLKMN
jgi:hypothetical protein